MMERATAEHQLLGWTPKNGSFYAIEPTQRVHPNNRIV
jgi:hypothetical protein